MLTGAEIRRQIKLGRITIDPFDSELINPNSIDVRLGDEMRVVNCNDYYEFSNPKIILKQEDGHKFFFLEPGRCYLGTTLERTYTPFHIPMINGKSTLGRKFIQIHQTAGFGDVGFDGQWTLEITVAFPTRLYIGQRIAQICFFEPVGEIEQVYQGKYQGQIGPTSAR